MSCFTAAFVFCLVEGYNHAAAFAQDAALFFKTDDGDKEKCYLIELAAKGLGSIVKDEAIDQFKANLTKAYEEKVGKTPKLTVLLLGQKIKVAV